jgi:hypothetical protein
MCWPNPGDPHEVEWRLRYGTLMREDLLYAASVIHAYAHLFDLPQKARNKRIEQIKEARRGHTTP